MQSASEHKVQAVSQDERAGSRDGFWHGGNAIMPARHVNAEDNGNLADYYLS
jgi:hypothetical protein